ncbi:hypothetical protein QAD02_002979 [Eretmocerus hayati]|uniref:Uncharacterized protein n=1 Tax=Eretmocerus hayati TaxID=131215 RepID=A0ACC2NKL5_9HYME|nr:hypothetical protein QAD02_002979 [Eretmocerus hayati]
MLESPGGALHELAIDEKNNRLLHAIKCRNIDAVREMLAAGADADFINTDLVYINEKNGRLQACTSTLHEAIDAEDVAVFKLLLDSGADPNHTNSFGMSVLKHVISGAVINRTAMLRLLLSSGVCDMYCAGNFDMSEIESDIDLMAAAMLPFDTSLINNRVSDVRLFLDFGYDIDHHRMYTTTMTTPLHLALTLEDDPTMLSLLLDYYQKICRCVDEINKNGHTPFRLAVTMGLVEHAKILLKAGANVNLPDIDGDTPLEFIIFETSKPHLECIRLLTEAGANVASTFDRLRAYLLVDYVHSLQCVELADSNSSSELTSTDSESDLDSADDARNWALFMDAASTPRMNLDIAKCVVRYRLLFESKISVLEPLSPGMFKSARLLNYFELCKSEISKLQRTSLNHSVTFHDLLVESNFHVQARLKSAIADFHEVDVQELFPLYAQDLITCYNRVVEINRVKDLATVKFNILLWSHPDAYHLISCLILRYLHENDIRNLSNV